jgi:uncharacterized protein
VVGCIELPEQEGLRMITNVIGCEPSDVRIGMPVSVTFEQTDERVVPQFQPFTATTRVPR